MLVSRYGFVFLFITFVVANPVRDDEATLENQHRFLFPNDTTTAVEQTTSMMPEIETENRFGEDEEGVSCII